MEKIKDTSEKAETKKSKKATSAKKDILQNQSISVNPIAPQQNIALQSEFSKAPANNIVPSVHIDLQIHISPEASAEQIDTIFASIAKHLYGRR